MPGIYITEAAKICRVNNKTLDRFIKKGLIKVIETIPRKMGGKKTDMRILDKAEVIRFAKRLPKKRRPGFPLIIKN